MDKIFKVYDIDGDGKLNKSEGSQYLTDWSEEELGIAPGKKMVEQLFEELDDN